MPNEEVRSQEWIDRIEELVRRAESTEDPKLRGTAVDLVRAVLDFHAAGLERMLEITADSSSTGEEIIRRMASDDLASSLLLLHGLHPDDLETRVSRAVEKLQQMFGPRGATVSLLAIEEDTVRLRLDTANGWSGAQAKTSIDAAIYQAAPEIVAIVVEGFREPAAPNFVPLSNLMSGSLL